MIKVGSAVDNFLFRSAGVDTITLPAVIAGLSNNGQDTVEIEAWLVSTKKYAVSVAGLDQISYTYHTSGTKVIIHAENVSGAFIPSHSIVTTILSV